MDNLKPSNPNDITYPATNPFLFPFLGLAPGESLDLNPIPQETALSNPQDDEMFTPRGPINDLMRFRQQFPYVPIIPFPPQVRTVVLAANVAKDIDIPDVVVAVLLRGNADYYISNHGNAEIPIDGLSKSIYKPDGIMFFTGGIKNLSVIAPAACIVTLLGYAPSELPRYAT